MFIMIVVELFSWAFLLFSYRFGYLIMFKKFKFRQLKSVFEYLTIVRYGLEDLLATVLTIVKRLLLQIFEIDVCLKGRHSDDVPF